MERWKRLSNKLAYQWGTFDIQIFERPRTLYYGDLERSPITNQQERRYPTYEKNSSERFYLILFFRWKRVVKKYLVTYPIVMCCLAFSLWIYFTYYRIQKKTDEKYSLEKSLFLIQGKFIRMIPSAGYSLLIIPMNFVYKKLAIFMTNFGRKS